MTGSKLRLALVMATALTACPVAAQEAPVAPVSGTGAVPADAAPLEVQFQNPPGSARPRVWWHWMNGNVTKDGIAKDFAWMKRVGIGGVQNFDASLMTPQIVDKRLVYMTPEWKDAFAFAAAEADRQGLELAIAASPGWSETGGPWVRPEDGLKKLVWSETTVAGGKRFSGTLAAPPTRSGPFQGIGMSGGVEELITGVKAKKEPPTHYGDVAVLAFPQTAAPALPQPLVRDGQGKALALELLVDGDLENGLALSRSADGTAPSIVLDYPAPVTVRSASLFIPNAAAMFAGDFFLPVLEASDNGTDWNRVVELPTGAVPATVSFPAVTARHFRVVINPAKPVALLGVGVPGTVMGDSMAGMGKVAAGRPVTVGELRLSAEPLIDRYETKAGFSITQDYYSLTTVADGASGIAPASVIDLTSRMRADGTLDWKAPSLPDGGSWRVLRFGYSLLGTTNHPAPPEATGLEVDKFDGAAVRGYLEHYIGMYRDAAGADMIGKRGVRAILTDSIEVGAANWTPKLVAQFRRLRGYDPTPYFPALTGTLVGSRADSDRFLYDYRRTLADLIASEHYGVVAQVARQNGLKVYGEALEDHRPSLGDDMAMRSHADVPMAAMWTHSREDGPRVTYLADIRGAASVAHIYGQNLVAAESMTSAMSPWAFAPADLKRIIDLEFVNGVNRPVVHTSVHVPVDDHKPGLSLFIFGQYFNRNETWAEMAGPWVDYMARNALMLQQGRNVADVGYFYGEEAPLTGLYGDTPVADAPRCHGFDFVNADALGAAMINQGNELVTQGGARYRAIYLGGTSRRMTLATLKRLAALVEGGATVVGLAPEANPGLAGDASEYAALVAKLWPGSGDAMVGKGRVIASTDIEAALATIGVAPDFRYTGGQEGSEIPFVHRKLTDGESYFLVNRRNRPETIAAHFRVTGKAPELWHAETGTFEPLAYRIENGETVVPLALLAEDAVHVVFRKPARGDALVLAQPVAATPVPLAGPWTVTFQENRGAPASLVLPALAPLETHADPGVKYFSGIATYTSTFTAPRGWKAGKPLWIDLGRVGDLAEVRVNGKLAGTPWHAPFRVDAGAMARKGRNRIEVRVANLWVNRLVGDAQPGAKPITYTAMPTYRADAPLRPSGLIGPVTVSGGR